MIKWKMIILLFLISNLTAQEQSSSEYIDNTIYQTHNISISGLVITPTAYRSKGINEIGSAFDINAVYYIGRLYSKNNFFWTVDKKNYLDRIGLWYLEADGKLLLQKEQQYVPAFASGAKASFTFRDSPQPNLNSPSASFKVDSKNTNQLLSVYLVISKHFNKNLIGSFGYSSGDMTKTIFMLSEFLSDRSSQLTYNRSRRISDTSIFMNLFYILKEKNIIGFEIIIPQGSTFSPKLINFQLANFLKLNFQLSYLSYNGGDELLGMFNFRYTFYPRIKKL
ncbi:MAG: hypothetical protein N2Z20_03730 [Elusimicrobiales bacterium]|nr:hypothetical protein [Elusimicrobiales bacterium]